MKNRNWICYLLDFSGVIALIGAAVSLGLALWFQASVAEAMWLKVFAYSLGSSVALLLTARICELAGILRSATPVAAPAPLETPDNVESLPRRERLPQAA